MISTIKANWKKTALFSVLLSYGALTVKSHYDIQKHMRNVCSVALRRDAACKDSKRILVVLNPIANKHKCEKDQKLKRVRCNPTKKWSVIEEKALVYFLTSNRDFEFRKYCEPILHLAGYTVETMKTNYVGHAKSYLENTDSIPHAIVVAGGEGTASEVITGLLRSGKTSCPIALLPMGSNSFTSFPFNKLAYVTNLTNSAMLLLKWNTNYENVIKVESLYNDVNKLNRPIFGINSFKWGILRDLDVLKNKYWYFGILKKHAAILFNAFSDNLTWSCLADVTYTPPCNGCKNCKFVRNPNQFWLKYLHSKGDSKEIQNERDNSEHCRKETTCSVNTSQITTTTLCKEKRCQLVTKSYMKITPGVDFIRNFFLSNSFENQPSLTLYSRTIQVVPTASYENKYFSIDGEEYEVRPIRISLVPKAIQLFL